MIIIRNWGHGDHLSIQFTNIPNGHNPNQPIQIYISYFPPRPSRSKFALHTLKTDMEFYSRTYDEIKIPSKEDGSVFGPREALVLDFWNELNTTSFDWFSHNCSSVVRLALEAVLKGAHLKKRGLCETFKYPEKPGEATMLQIECSDVVSTSANSTPPVSDLASSSSGNKGKLVDETKPVALTVLEERAAKSLVSSRQAKALSAISTHGKTWFNTVCTPDSVFNYAYQVRASLAKLRSSFFTKTIKIQSPLSNPKRIDSKTHKTLYDTPDYNHMSAAIGARVR